jgi:2,3-bisphosphoglycerate-independent phosphoglycerate mutase
MCSLLCILDGFGLNPNPDSNAVAIAKKPTIDHLLKNYPNTTLVTFGERVGLPEGQMGNSEVGHLNIGGGRVIEQWLLRISRACKNGTISESANYLKFIEASKNADRVHMIGLYSDGGVHSHSQHAEMFIEILSKELNIPISLHLISDGRDTSPKQALSKIGELEERIKKYKDVTIASLSGRFYAMDRDKRWERVEAAYRAMALGEGQRFNSANDAIQASYAVGASDEFIKPCVINPQKITSQDALFFWNFREDRMREIVSALTQDDFSGFKREAPLPLRQRIIGMTEYDDNFHLSYIFEQLEIKNHLGEVLSKSGIKQLRVAETEKYPHVTFFFNGGIEKPYPGEDREMCPSPRDVKTYDLKPEMSAQAVADVVCKAILNKSHGCIIVNFANCDMVGHTGNLEAAIKAVECVDKELGRILKCLDKVSGEALILADHGNADQMIDYQDRSPHTAHTTHPVPCIYYSCDKEKLAQVKGLRSGGALCDVAPTFLELLSLPQPKEMTGKSLILKDAYSYAPRTN